MDWVLKSFLPGRKTFFPSVAGDSVTKILSSQSRGPRFNPQSGNQIPHTTTKSLHIATKDLSCHNKDGRPQVQSSQINTGCFLKIEGLDVDAYIYQTHKTNLSHLGLWKEQIRSQRREDQELKLSHHTLSLCQCPVPSVCWPQAHILQAGFFQAAREGASSRGYGSTCKRRLFSVFSF